ncbi:lipid kinase [Aquibium microcysteis]|uniref:lipid kinase n=1 Tax=Aquibium microcysteis TaxID=675281 RepID=UPI00165D043C|nr:lipid kinase [Aquibium microcysteis]
MQDRTDAPKRRALLLFNPGARRAGEGFGAVMPRLVQGGLAVTVEPFAALPEIARDIVRLRETADLIVLCGGDGTIASGAMAVMESGLPLGIIPMGTANDLARTLDIPLDLEQAAEVIVAGATRRIDVGSVNGHAFFNVASIGLSADLARKLDAGLKKRWGRLGYAVAALKVLSRARRFEATITEKEDETQVSTYQIAVGNGRHYGGGNVVEEKASIDDGHLDLYSLEVSNVWKLAAMMRSFRAGRQGLWSEVRTAKCVRFDVVTKRPMPVNTDGEIVTATPARFMVHPGAVEVFVPKA